MTEWFLRYVLPPALAGSLMVLLLLLARPLLARLAAGWRRGLLLGAGAVFLLPLAPLAAAVSALAGHFAGLFAGAGQPAAPAAAPAPPGFGALPAAAPAYQAGQALQAMAAQAAPAPTAAGAAAGPGLATLLVQAAGWLYLGAALALLLGAALRYLWLMRQLRRQCRPAAGGPLAALYAKACAEMGLPTEKCPPLYTGPAAAPMLAGLLSPRLVMPESGLDGQQALFALKHELAHWRQRDIAVKLAATALCCLYWFSPCVWALRRQINDACEESCDERVAAGLDSAGRRQYADTLLKLAGPPPAAGLALAGPARRLRRRLQRLMRPARAGKAARRVALAATALCAALALLAGCGLAAGSGEVPLSSSAPAAESASQADSASVPPAAESGLAGVEVVSGTEYYPLDPNLHDVIDEETLRLIYEAVQAAMDSEGKDLVEHDGRLYLTLPGLRVFMSTVEPQPTQFMLKTLDGSVATAYHVLAFPLAVPDFMGEAGSTYDDRSITLTRPAEADSPVLAAGVGTVLAVEAAGDGSVTVSIEHRDGLITEYAGLATAEVEPGQVAGFGQAIGKTGGAALSFTMRCAEPLTPVMIYSVNHYDESDPLYRSFTTEVLHIPAE